MTHETRPSCAPFVIAKITGLPQPAIEAMLTQYVDRGWVDIAQDEIAVDTRALLVVLRKAGLRTLPYTVAGTVASHVATVNLSNHPAILLQFGTEDNYGHALLHDPRSGLLFDCDHPDGVPPEDHPEYDNRCGRAIFFAPAA